MMEKYMMRSIWSVLLVLAFFASVGALRAQAQPGGPALAPLRTFRDRYVMVFNGSPLRVCQTEWASWSRAHGVCRDLVTLDLPDRQLLAGHLVEFVVYDGIRYERADDSTTWMSMPDPDFDPDRSLNDAMFHVIYTATLTAIGTATVEGETTTQYQYWSHDESLNELSGGPAVFDLFVAPDNHVVKSQFSARGQIAGLGAGELADIWVFTHQNTEIAVAPPPPEQVQPMP
jgi:hypothetical protein